VKRCLFITDYLFCL